MDKQSPLKHIIHLDDDKLVYRKGIVKRLEDYTKNVPQKSNAAYDYDHYSQKQLAPIADMVLRFFDLEFRSLTEEPLAGPGPAAP